MDRQARVYVAGGRTLIGAALLRVLAQQGYRNIVGKPGDEPDLTSASQVEAFWARTAPEYVFVAAGKTGGIQANQQHPADLMHDNLSIQGHVIQSAHRYGVRKLLYLASSCSYPRHCAQPMRPESLLTGPLEPTNQAYAVAKIAGIVLCQAYRQQDAAPFISAIPANPFGPGDDFRLEESHVIPALIRRTHEAKRQGAPAVTIWGTGTARREFIFADDLADACVFAMRHYDGWEPINLGGGGDRTIEALATDIKDVVGYQGELRFDATKPDGMPVKVLDASILQGLGWSPSTPFRQALAATYRWFLAHEASDAASFSDSIAEQDKVTAHV